jgi:hypothetical protein
VGLPISSQRLSIIEGLERPFGLFEGIPILIHPPRAISVNLVLGIKQDIEGIRPNLLIYGLSFMIELLIHQERFYRSPFLEWRIRKLKAPLKVENPLKF